MSGENGSVKLMSSKRKLKYENNIQESRASITILRTVDTSGNTDTTIFLLKGKGEMIIKGY